MGSWGSPIHQGDWTPPGHWGTHRPLLPHHGLLAKHLLLLLPLYGSQGGGGTDGVQRPGGLGAHWRGHPRSLWVAIDCRGHAESIQLTCNTKTSNVDVLQMETNDADMYVLFRSR